MTASPKNYLSNNYPVVFLQQNIPDTCTTLDSNLFFIPIAKKALISDPALQHVPPTLISQELSRKESTSQVWANPLRPVP